jgi:hypothetical protein
MQHWAAYTLAPSPPSSDGKVGFHAARGVRARDRGFKMPVLQPTTFDLGHVLDALAWTIVHRRRKAKAYQSSCSSMVSRRGSAADLGSCIFRNSKSFENHAINGHKASLLIDGPITDENSDIGHKGLSVVHFTGHKGLESSSDRYPQSKTNRVGIAKILGLAWSRSVGAAPVLGAISGSQRGVFLHSIMAGRGSRPIEPNFGAGAGPSFGKQPGAGGGNGPPAQFRGFGSGSCPTGGSSNLLGQQVRGINSGFVGNVNMRNNNFIPRNKNQGFVPQGNIGNNFGSANAGNGSGSYGAPPHMLRNISNQQGAGDGNEFMEVDMIRGNNQQSFEGFNGNFRNFDEGYFEGGQNSNQSHDGYSYGNQRNKYNFRQGFNGGRGRGVRYGYGRGRFIPRGGGCGTLVQKNQTAREGSSTGADLQKGAGSDLILERTSLSSVKNDVKEKDILCFRCNLNGHLATNCTATLCIYCDSTLHKDEECHLLSMPKPTGTMYGLCRESLLFMYVPKTPDVRMKISSGKVGRIGITGGVMNIQQVIKELSWLVPGDHQWEIYASGANMFKVNYTTKADYERVRKIKSIEVEETRSKFRNG